MGKLGVFSLLTLGCLLCLGTTALGQEAGAARETLVAGSAESAPAGDDIRFEPLGGALLSESQLADFANPPRLYRPLQIVHGRDLTDPKIVQYYRDDCGLGGLVVNVGGSEYVRSEENWSRFQKGLQNIKDLGMRAWIYDEDGYPSLGAGGVVLEGHPELGALELAFDPERDPPYYVRDCYEHTHSCNNYSCARRYPNPLNSDATKRFIDVTHRGYRDRLPKDLYDYVEAFFTDEPSMMAANLGAIPEESRSRVRTLDPLDPNKKVLPVVSWCEDLEAKYLERYGEELSPHFSSLFEGDSDEDKKVRRQFWSLLGELNRERYYEQIRDFCREDPEGPVSSGHTLYEENIVVHVPLDGNKIDALKRMDLPGLDMLNSDPVAYFYGCWLAAAFPCSAATFNGSRRVMTEVSDFSQVNSGDRQPVDLPTMEAVAGWHAAFGVTDYTLYYGVGGAPYRNESTHRDYSRFVGRLNAVLWDATPVRPILLYYPIEELQEEFRPYAGNVGDMSKQSERARQIHESFNQLGGWLSRIQTCFYVADRKTLQNLTKNPNDPEEAARLQGKFSGVIFPRWAKKVDYDWNNANFKEYWVSEEKPLTNWEDAIKELKDFTGPRLTPKDSNPNCIEGCFERDGRLVFMITNPLTDPWDADFTFTSGIGGDVSFENDRWTLLNPQTGAVEAFSSNGDSIRAHFDARGTLILASPVVKR